MGRGDRERHERCPNTAWARVEQKLRARGVLPTVRVDLSVEPMEWRLRIDKDVVVRGRTIDDLAFAAEEWFRAENAPREPERISAYSTEA